MWHRLASFRPQRKDILFVAGLIGLALQESRAFGEPSEALLLIYAAMMGLPILMRADEGKTESPPSMPDMKNGPGSSVGGEQPSETPP